jgi:fructose-specific phosphotransferase system IIA component
MIKWQRILSESNILVGLKSQRHLDAVRELAEVFKTDQAVTDHKKFLAELLRREQRISTGIGKGVAVPHAHADCVERQRLAIGISTKGIEFDAADGQPVYIIALFVTPIKHRTQHMELLAALSRLMQQESIRQELIAAVDAAQVVEIVTQKKQLA